MVFVVAELTATQVGPTRGHARGGGHGQDHAAAALVAARDGGGWGRGPAYKHSKASGWDD